VDGVSVSYDVTIKESELPNTGQDFTWVWLLCSAALMLVGAGAIALKRKAAK
jgi:LPXTG-motif cell wall-anchored protein